MSTYTCSIWAVYNRVMSSANTTKSTDFPGFNEPAIFSNTNAFAPLIVAALSSP